jgi:hypothetical protein
LSTRIDRGRPHRWKTRRNKARASLGGIVCHWAWGGKPVRQRRPGVDVDGGHPADLLAGLEPLLLDGVHFPDVVGCLRLGAGRPWSLSAPGSVDPLLLEGTLKGARRWDERGLKTPEQLDADPSGPPSRVLPLELTGSPQDVGMVPRRGPTAPTIGDGQALLAAMTERPPKGADRDMGQVEVDRDL